MYLFNGKWACIHCNVFKITVTILKPQRAMTWHWTNVMQWATLHFVFRFHGGPLEREQQIAIGPPALFWPLLVKSVLSSQKDRNLLGISECVVTTHSYTERICVESSIRITRLECKMEFTDYTKNHTNNRITKVWCCLSLATNRFHITFK